MAVGTLPGSSSEGGSSWVAAVDAAGLGVVVVEDHPGGPTVTFASERAVGMLGARPEDALRPVGEGGRVVSAVAHGPTSRLLLLAPPTEASGPAADPLAVDARFRTLVEVASDAVVVTRRGVIDWANDAATRALGYPPGALVGLDWGRLLPADELTAMRERVGEMIRTGTVLPPRAYRGIRADGTEVVLEIASRVLFEGAEPVVIGFGRDLTERRRLEAQIANADRLSALGTMAAGVAHEINNPLAYVSLSAEALNDQVARSNLHPSEKADLLELVARIREGADRVATIVRDMRVFTRQDAEALPRPVDVRPLVEAGLRLVRHDLRSRARLSASLEPLWALAIPGRLEQVVVNLLVNAGQALREDRLDSRIDVRVESAPEGVVIEVQDDGIGISPEDLARVFDPFFTTKAPGVGTGLGLSVCHSLVHQMGGQIELHSTPGAGTTARVVLRPAEAPRPVEEASTRARAPASIPRLRLLVVDDEPLIAEAVAALLEDVHAVTVAIGGAAGLEHALRGPWDAVLCDLAMPELSGMDVFARVRDHSPDLADRFVFMTGGATTERARAFLGSVPNPTLEKPFRFSALAGVLESLARRSVC